MARLYPLFSSSKGNSTFIGTEKGGILIDCGVSFKRLSEALEVNHIPLSAVQGVFSTHEHSDHVAGLAMLTKKTGMPVYGQKRTLQRLCDTNRIAVNSPVIDMTGKTIKRLSISSGMDSVSVGGYELGEGMFLYSLIVNGQEIDTKKMVITI